jgi:rhamnulokinase
MNPTYYIACDLGAESGRVMLGRLEDGRLALEEIHRFPSAAVRVLGSLRWDCRKGSPPFVRKPAS